MQALFAAYHSSLVALFVLAALVILQSLIADVAGIRAKHVPGMPVTDGHKSFFFRAVRAHGNSYENLGLFLLLVLVCLFAGASVTWVRNWIWVFVAARAAHMACYYADLRTARSAAFTAGVVAELGLLGCAYMAL
ncbi:MAG: MAPEG family protein [Pseudomonadota bacterium]